jgi:catechol 2,3-dioxygenase-like lactoylglutathione lyase family enzyme
MNTVDGQSAPSGWPGSEPADLKLEAVVIPVADADRSKAFYTALGWRLDAHWSDWYADYMVREHSGQELPV